MMMVTRCGAEEQWPVATESLRRRLVRLPQVTRIKRKMIIDLFSHRLGNPLPPTSPKITPFWRHHPSLMSAPKNASLLCQNEIETFKKNENLNLNLPQTTRDGGDAAGKRASTL